MYSSRRSSDAGFLATLIAWIIVLLLVVLIVGIVMIYGTLACAFVLRYLWVWFIIPVFHLPELTMGQAAGLGLVIAFLTHQTTTNKEEDDSGKKNGKIAAALLSPWITLGIGYLIHTFMH